MSLPQAQSRKPRRAVVTDPWRPYARREYAHTYTDADGTRWDLGLRLEGAPLSWLDVKAAAMRDHFVRLGRSLTRERVVLWTHGNPATKIVADPWRPRFRSAAQALLVRVVAHQLRGAARRIGLGLYGSPLPWETYR